MQNSDKWTLFLLLAFGGLVIIILGSMLADDSKEVSGDEYDTSFYVEDSGNLFIKTAKVLDKCCYYVVDIVVSSVPLKIETSIFKLFD